LKKERNTKAMAYSTKLYLPLKTPCFVPKTVRAKTLMLQQSQVHVKVKKATVSQPQPIRYSTKNIVRSSLSFCFSLEWIIIFLKIQTQPFGKNMNVEIVFLGTGF
jgi:hypothetical protein